MVDSQYVCVCARVPTHTNIIVCVGTRAHTHTHCVVCVRALARGSSVLERLACTRRLQVTVVVTCR